MYSYARNSPLSLVDPDGRAVVALTRLALQRIQSTLPRDVRSQVIADKNGMLNRSAIDAIKSTDSNVDLLKQAVDADKTIEVTTAPAVQGGNQVALTESLVFRSPISPSRRSRRRSKRPAAIRQA